MVNNIISNLEEIKIRKRIAELYFSGKDGSLLNILLLKEGFNFYNIIECRSKMGFKEKDIYTLFPIEYLDLYIHHNIEQPNPNIKFNPQNNENYIKMKKAIPYREVNDYKLQTKIVDVYINKIIEKIDVYCCDKELISATHADRIPYHVLDEDMDQLLKLTNLKSIFLLNSKPEYIELINKLPNLETINIDCIYSGKNKWRKITNLSIKECYLNGWEGKFEGISLPPNIEILGLNRQMARLVNSGLKDLTKLRKISTFAHPKTQLQVILDHPTIEEIDMNGVKEESVILKNDKIKSLKVEDSNIKNLKIYDNQLEILNVFSSSELELIVENESKQLKELALLGQKVKSIEFLKKVPNVEILYLGGLDTLDINDLITLTNLKSLTLRNIKNITGISKLSQLKNLKHLKLFNIKKTDIDEPIPLILETFDAGLIDYKFIQELIKGSVITNELNLYHTKICDIIDLKDISKIKEINLSSIKIDNASLLKKATNLNKLSIYSPLNKFDIKVIKDLNNLKWLSIPKYEDQKDIIINEIVKRENCYINLTQLSENTIEIEEMDSYNGFNINCYINTKDNTKKYGIFLDLSEDLNVYNNYDVESKISKKINKDIRKNYDFDSEAENFCVYTNDIENLHSLIDLIIELTKSSNKNL
ncbi:MAG: hypothetical protein K0Q49_1502 [Haloplasmataceae bacterium]|jgi:hypothetical protein|nr:hypothetical protein [Haloplasmataceae bacterium]